jgi:hypothetical protein
VCSNDHRYLNECKEIIELTQAFVDTDVEPGDWDGSNNPFWYVYGGRYSIQLPVVVDGKKNLIELPWSGDGLPQKVTLCLQKDDTWCLLIVGGKTGVESVRLPQGMIPLAKVIG